MRILDALFAARPMVLVPAWSFFILGTALGGAHVAFPTRRFVLFTLAMIAVHLVNQVVDADTDRLNGKGLFLQRGIWRPRQYLVAATACLVLSLGLGWWYDESPFVLMTAAGLGLAYSIPPLRFAARAGLDVVANAIGYGVVAPLLGASPIVPPAPFVIGTAAAVAAVFVHTTLLDQDGDRRTGKRTIGVVLGPHRGRVLAATLGVIATAGSCAAGPWFVGLASAVLAALCIAAVPFSERLTSRTVCVAGTAIYALAASWQRPLFLGALVLLAATTRLYYARRFALRYPAL